MSTLVIAELLQGEARKATHAAMGCAASIGAPWDVLVIGEGADKAAQTLTQYGARKVLTAEIAGGYVCERYAPTVAEVAKQGGYDVLVASATTYGKDLLGRVAAKLEAGLASDVTKVEKDGDKLRFVRPMYAGNVFGTVGVTTPLKVVTLRQSEFEPPAQQDGASPVEAVQVVPGAFDDRIEFVSFEQSESERPDLSEADVVVSGGRALKSAENFDALLEPLTDLLGGAIGASRAACDAGMAAQDLQVGQTGKVVAPKLYVAIGISGAIQHLAGMKGSKVIVAINKDKEAPIVQVADYVLAQDLFEVVPELTSAIKSIKAAS